MVGGSTGKCQRSVAISEGKSCTTRTSEGIQDRRKCWVAHDPNVEENKFNPKSTEDLFGAIPSPPLVHPEKEETPHYQGVMISPWLVSDGKY